MPKVKAHKRPQRQRQEGRGLAKFLPKKTYVEMAVEKATADDSEGYKQMTLEALKHQENLFPLFEKMLKDMNVELSADDLEKQRQRFASSSGEKQLEFMRAFGTEVMKQLRTKKEEAELPADISELKIAEEKSAV